MQEKKKTILAIDDNIATLTTISSILERSYEVSLARNAEIAKTILNTAKVDLILLDMEMPDVSGMEFLSIIRNDNSFYHIPIIIVSSHGTTDVIIDAKKEGAADFVVKPISPQILLEKIRLILKTERRKISKTGLLRKLQLLENSCAIGKGGQIKKEIEDLEHIYFDFKTDLEITEICRLAKEMEYNLARGKIKQLLNNLSE